MDDARPTNENASVHTLISAGIKTRSGFSEQSKCTDRYDWRRACLGVFTSGSTGEPKLALHSCASLFSAAEGANSTLSLHNTDRVLLSLPLNHIAGLAQIFRSVQAACTLVIPKGKAEDSMVLLEHRISHVSLVSTQLQRLLAMPVVLPRLACMLVGGGPSNREAINTARKLGYPVWLSYGLTETASLVIAESPEGKQHRITGAEVCLSAVGEVLIRGDNLFLGYWQRGVCVDPKNGDGYFYTGDLAVEQNGRLCLEGRKDNVFVSGGKNIQPQTIELALCTLQNIAAAVVVPVAHPEYGHVPFAFVALRDWLAVPASVDVQMQQTIIESMRTQLPGYMIPRFYGALPSSDGLKPQRKPLAHMAEQIMTNVYGSHQ